MAWIFPCLLALALALAVRARRVPGALGVCVAASVPFVTPAEPQWFRLTMSAFAIVWAARVWERARGREGDIESRWWSFWLWWLIPADARSPCDATAAARHRREGWMRLARVVPKAAVVLGVVLVNRAVDDITAHPLPFTLWSMVYVYTFISAIADGLTGLLMLTGLQLSESFDAPMLARSPPEFWGRRWNRFVTRWAFFNVFVPTGGRRSPARATMLVFLTSGLMHEYLLIACAGGLGDHTGWMLAFFLVHGAAVVLTSRVPWSLPRTTAIGANLMFLIVTAPLFFTPLDEAVGYSRWWTAGPGTRDRSPAAESSPGQKRACPTPGCRLTLLIHMCPTPTHSK